MDETDLAVVDPILPSEQVLIDLMADGYSFPEAALQAFPFKDDPIAFANFRLKKRELYRAAVIAYSDKKFSDFEMVDTYSTILNDSDSDSHTKLKALKDYHIFKESFTHEQKQVSVSIGDGSTTINQKIIQQFFENPSPSGIIPPVLIPKEHIYAKTSESNAKGKDTRQLSDEECEGDVRKPSRTDPE